MVDGQKRIKAKSVHPQGQQSSKRELWATVCYHYPQYTLQEASKLSVRDIKMLEQLPKEQLAIVITQMDAAVFAEKINAQNKYDYTQIVAAPHTKKGSGVKKLTEHFKKQMD